MSTNTNLISAWDGLGNTLDSFGTNHLTAVGTFGYFPGGGFDMVAANMAQLEIVSNASLQTGDIDFGIYLEVMFRSLGAGVQTIASKAHDAIGAGGEWHIEWNGSTLLRVGVRNAANDTTTNRTFASLGTPVINTWYALQAWHDAVNNTLNAQGNNGAIDSTPYSGGVFSGTKKFVIGNRDGGNVYLNAVVRRIRFWKRVREAGDYASLNAGKRQRRLGVSVGVGF